MLILNERTTYHRAEEFIRQYFAENKPVDNDGLEHRIQQIKAEIQTTGSYTHTYEELLFGARVAWRNSNRCVGRLSWNTLTVFDHRNLTDPDEIMSATVNYVKWAENGGKIRPAICVFAPRNPVTGSEIRFWNGKLIRYAGYENDGAITGDPDELDLTRACIELGWDANNGRFDLLPIVIQSTGYPTKYFEWKDWHEPVQVPIRHPQLQWFTELRLRWYAVPVISDMTLEIGGIEYTAAPFNGWFMGTEIGTRNLADEHRYNMLPEIARRMGLEIRNRSVLWKDRALTELNTAVLHSFKEDGVTIVDHHTAAIQFERFEQREGQAGRNVCADWTWLVPPTAGSATHLYHKQWSNEVKSPNYFYADVAYPHNKSVADSQIAGCPFHSKNNS
jgi:nitric-oxide synthase